MYRFQVGDHEVYAREGDETNIPFPAAPCIKCGSGLTLEVRHRHDVSLDCTNDQCRERYPSTGVVGDA